MNMRRNTGRSRRGGGTLPSIPWVYRYTSDAAFLTKDGSNIVSPLSDRGTANLQLANGVTARRPLWVDNAAPSGTADVVRFTVDGVNIKTLTATPPSAPFGLNGYTLFFVFNRTAGSTTHVLWFYHPGNIRGGWQLEFSSNLRSFQARTSAGVVKSLTFGTYTANTPEIWTVRNWGGGSDDVDSTTWFDVRVNGTTVAITGNPWFFIPTGHSMSLGNTTATAGPVIDFMEARMTNSYLSTSDCSTVERELGATYGITVP